VEALESPAPNWRTYMATTKTKSQTKAAMVERLLSRTKGASIDEICKATSWQPHSVRAFLTGMRKKGFALPREQRDDDGTCYRITQRPDEINKAACS